MILDNFALSTFQTCPAKWLLAIREGWRPRRASGALNAGLVLHKGLEYLYKGHSKTDCIKAMQAAWPAEVPVDDFRDLTKVVTTFMDYTHRYDRESWQIVGADEGEPMVEVNFTLPTGMWLDRCPGCGHDNAQSPYPVESDLRYDHCIECFAPLEPIEYGGIFDLLVEQSGFLYVVDHKTTTRMGPYYFNQFKPNNQMTGYVWAGGQLSGRKCGGAVVNAIGWYKASPTKFERQITTRTARDIASWLENVRQVANMIRRAEVLGEFPLSTGACTMYGRCEYHQVHELDSPELQQKMLEMSYEKRPWNHEARDDEVPAA